MQNLTFDNTSDSDVTFYQRRAQLLHTLKNRFTTYGYKQIQTSTFEAYDLYTTVNGTIRPDEMIKIIDQSGKVLVMRPDVTIPITSTLPADRKSTRLNSRHVANSNAVFCWKKKPNSRRK